MAGCKRRTRPPCPPRLPHLDFLFSGAPPVKASRWRAGGRQGVLGTPLPALASTAVGQPSLRLAERVAASGDSTTLLPADAALSLPPPDPPGPSPCEAARLRRDHGPWKAAGPALAPRPSGCCRALPPPPSPPGALAAATAEEEVWEMQRLGGRCRGGLAADAPGAGECVPAHPDRRRPLSTQQNLQATRIARTRSPRPPCGAAANPRTATVMAAAATAHRVRRRGFFFCVVERVWGGMGGGSG